MIYLLLLPNLLLGQSTEQADTVYKNALEEFHYGSLKGKALISLANASKQRKQDDIALQIAILAKSTWIEKQKPLDIFNTDLKDFINNFILLFSLKDKLVNYIIKYPNEVDRACSESGFGKRISNYMISRYFVNPALQTATDAKVTPAWDQLENSVARRFGKKIAMKILLESKIQWYSEREDWENIIKYNIQNFETNGLDTVGFGKSFINNFVFDVVFKHSNDSIVLSKGLIYIETILKTNPNRTSWLDTYANVLYKLGRKDEAISYEKKAITIAQKNNNKSGIIEYTDMLNKMLLNEPTW